MKRGFGSVIEDVSVDEGNQYLVGHPGRGPRGIDELRRIMGSPGATIDSRCRYPDPAIAASLARTGDFPKSIRDYEAWALYFEKRRTESEPWQFRFSYTLSWLRANYTGLFNSDSGQNLPNVSAYFDSLSLTPNTFGYLPNDHRHIFTLFCSYQLPAKWLGKHEVIVGLRLNAESGAPLSRLRGHELYGPGAVFIERRGGAGRLPWFIAADLYFEYRYRFTKDVRLSFTAVIFNPRHSCNRVSFALTRTGTSGHPLRTNRGERQQ